MAKILVIDDDFIVRMTIVRLLEEAGHDVLAAKDGLRGMAVFRNTEPDLVITDIIMPEQEGIQTIEEILKAKPDAKISPPPAAGASAIMIFLRSRKLAARWRLFQSRSIWKNAGPREGLPWQGGLTRSAWGVWRA
jgi:CheY-like chemotaxis protein